MKMKENATRSMGMLDEGKKREAIRENIGWSERRFRKHEAEKILNEGK